MIYPKPLQPGDAIAIVSPASKIDTKLVDSACATLARWGFDPIVGRHCKGSCGSYSGTIDQRLSDLREAAENPKVRAVLCSRGGYGVVHLLSSLLPEFWKTDPKWIIGFSDISALHAAAAANGVASIHAPMCKHLTEHPDDECSQALRRILAGELPAYETKPNPLNHTGKAEGRIFGGNLAVLNGLVSTPYDLLKGDRILFIEDVGEEIYKVERMLYTLKLNGTLASLKALIVGQFTEYHPSDDHTEMYDMIEKMMKSYDIPVVYDFPVGHVDRNLPIVEGAYASLAVDADSVKLSFSKR